MSALEADNQIIALCLAGLEAEQVGAFDDARVLFEQAWRHSSDDVERCIAAHHVARQQDSLEKTLWWNQLALARADATRDERVRALYPSLHLGIGKAFEDLEQVATAQHHYEKAMRHVAEIADPSYRAIVEAGVRQSLERVVQLGSTLTSRNHKTRGTPHS